MKGEWSTWKRQLKKEHDTCTQGGLSLEDWEAGYLEEVSNGKRLMEEFYAALYDLTDIVEIDQVLNMTYILRNMQDTLTFFDTVLTTVPS